MMDCSDLTTIVERIKNLQTHGFVQRLTENSVDAEKLVVAYQQVKEILSMLQVRETSPSKSRLAHDSNGRSKLV